MTNLAIVLLINLQICLNNNCKEKIDNSSAEQPKQTPSSPPQPQSLGKIQEQKQHIILMG